MQNVAKVNWQKPSSQLQEVAAGKNAPSLQFKTPRRDTDLVKKEDKLLSGSVPLDAIATAVQVDRLLMMFT
jgi:hypothetical protein